MKKQLLSILNKLFNRLWYGKHPAYVALIPFAWIYQCVIFFRRFYLIRFSSKKFPVPVIIVGNLTVGGVGKTPLVIEIANRLKAKGIRVGIVSRGYGANIKKFPYVVQSQDVAEWVGDEPLLIFKNTNCPVVISPSRSDAVRYLLDKYQSEIVISDDGLQHYALARAIEIVVIDGERGLGNGFCLPAGPLRERAKRLLQSDFVVVNEQIHLHSKCTPPWPNIKGPWKIELKEDGTYHLISKIISKRIAKKNSQIKNEGPVICSMSMKPGSLRQISTQKVSEISSLEYTIAAVAGIGNPGRFFNTLTGLGFNFNPYPFPDHHPFQPNELKLNEQILIMTEKDAVKCENFAKESWYFLPIEARLDDSFWEALDKMLCSHEQL